LGIVRVEYETGRGIARNAVHERAEREWVAKLSVRREIESRKE